MEEGGEGHPTRMSPASGLEELKETQGAITPGVVVPPQSAEALTPQHQQIVDALYDTWSNDQERRKESERILSECEKEEHFILYLLDICCLTEVHNNVRKLAIIYSKNLVSRFWNCKDIFHFSNHIKKMVKEKILEILANRSIVSNYYREFCILLRKVARYELVNNFPQLLQFFVQELSAYRDNLNILDRHHITDSLCKLYIYMYLLYKVLREQYSKKLLKDKKETFHISQKFIDCLYPLWENNLNVYFQCNMNEACMCGSEGTCNKCFGEYSVVMELEAKLTFSPDVSSSECVAAHGRRNSSSIDGGESSDVHYAGEASAGGSDAYCCHFNADSDKKVKILKFMDSILLNLIISRDDVQRESGRIYQGGKAAYRTICPRKVDPPQQDGECALRKKPFLDCLANKTIFYLKFVRKDSPLYYLKYLKFLLSSFLHIIEFQSALHEYVKKDTTEQFICLFLKKHLSKDLYINSDSYESKFADIINICIGILKSLFYHFCLSQYNLIKQKKVRENYLTVKSMISNQNTFCENYTEKTDLQTKIINTLVVNINNLESENKKGRVNKNYTFRDILTYIREEVKYALTSDDYILMHNQKALEIFEFLRTHCINMSAEQIMDIMLNVKDKDGHEVEENIFYSSARECIIEIASEPFLFSIFSHFFEPLINSLHNYVHMIKSIPDKLKDLQVPEFSESIIELDGYLNIYYVLYSSLHKKIKAEHILCMIQFFTDYLSIQFTHPLISYRIALILKVWIKNYKASFPFIDEVTVLIFENIRLLCMHLSPKCVVGSLLRTRTSSDGLGERVTPPENHYAAMSANFLPLVFFKFVCLFNYIFKYEYVYENYDFINEILVGPLISLLTQITYPKSIQKILQILSHIVFISNKEKDITIFKDNYNFLLDLYKTSNLSIKEYMLNILVQILNKNYEFACGLVEFTPHEGRGRHEVASNSASISTRGDDNHKQSYYPPQGGSPHGGVLNKGGDDYVLFYFSLDVIAYTIVGRKIAEQPSHADEGIQYPLNPRALLPCGGDNYQPPSELANEVNLYVDQTISDSFYTLWLCNLKIISKLFSAKNGEIIKRVCSLYVRTVHVISEHFKRKVSNEKTHEMSSSCFDVLMEYMCLFILHETHTFYLTYESVSTNMLTNEILKPQLLAIVRNNFTLDDEGNMERCIYILHVCMGLYKNRLKDDIPMLYNYVANFVIIYLLKVVVKYMGKLFPLYTCFEGSPKGGRSSEKGSERESEKGSTGHLQGEKGREGPGRSFLQWERPAELLSQAEGHGSKMNKEDATHHKFMTHNERQTKYIYDNVLSYQREDSFDTHFGFLQNDLKQLLGIEYLKDYDLGAVFRNYNFHTVNEDNYTYVNKHTVLTLIAILSLDESYLLHYILICFLVYFRINVPLFLSSIFCQAQYIHNKSVMMALLLFIYVLTENYLFRDFVPSLVRSHLRTTSSSSTPYLEELLYDKNKCSDLFACTREDYTYLIIQLLKLINTILNTSRDIYIEKKNILHLNTVSSNLSATKMYHSAGYNCVMRGVLKYDDLPDVCNKALDNVLAFLLDMKNSDDQNATRAIVNYLRENVEGMNVALVNMYKKYLGYQ